MDSAIQRKNMVDSQVRPSDVVDRRIPRAMLAVPREAFVPAASRAVAYSDGNLIVSGPGGPERALLAPRTLAKMIQAMALNDDAAVLDIAPATGYSSAILGHFARHVVALECEAKLAEAGKAAVHGLGHMHVEWHVGDLKAGVEAKGPYDAILINGRISDAPATLLNQLKDGGRLIAVLDVNGVGKVYEWRRFAMSFDRRPLFDAEAPMLPGFERAAEFVL
ncbi:MAG: protein-L-isoaspartate O-methyltransferase [Proteobacteria bacterium]|nr:protein-L-isoaspartate O-methyltransferase [Pseudomonadota bacterium]